MGATLSKLKHHD
jgi:hypothetical protein